MKTTGIKILDSKNQLKLYGFDNYFYSFVNLVKKNNLPNTMLFNGPKGLGKSTFAYHLINFIFSSYEDNKYSISNYSINNENKSYINVCENIHPNFFLVDKTDQEESIKIELSRNLLKFLNKTTYKNNLKIVLIDNAELLNVNASNALLKAIEEPNINTFFFLISNNNDYILDTIRSRCVEFNFFLSSKKKSEVFNKLASFYLNDNELNIDNKYFYETHGNILRYLQFLDFDPTHLKSSTPDLIIHLIDKFKKTKESINLSFLTFLIEIYYNELSLVNQNLEMHYNNKFNLLKKIDNVKKFNLDKKNLFTSIEGIFGR